MQFQHERALYSLNGLRGMAVLGAILKSAQSGKTIRLAR
jgi:hypothetical protein